MHGLPRISTIIRERRLSFSGHCWRSKNEVVSDLVLWVDLVAAVVAVVVVVVVVVVVKSIITVSHKHIHIPTKCMQLFHNFIVSLSYKNTHANSNLHTHTKHMYTISLNTGCLSTNLCNINIKHLWATFSRTVRLTH